MKYTKTLLSLSVAVASIVALSVNGFAQDKPAAPKASPAPAAKIAKKPGSKKPLPPRDAKGRFIKKGATPAGAPSPAAAKKP